MGDYDDMTQDEAVQANMIEGEHYRDFAPPPEDDPEAYAEMCREERLCHCWEASKTRKTRPVHKLRPSGQSALAFTWCGVDAYRQGVQVAGVHVLDRPADCGHCLREESRAGSLSPTKKNLQESV